MPAAVEVVYRRRSQSMPRRHDRSSDLPTLHCRAHRIVASAGGTPIGKAPELPAKYQRFMLAACPLVVSFVLVCENIVQ